MKYSKQYKDNFCPNCCTGNLAVAIWHGVLKVNNTPLGWAYGKVMSFTTYLQLQTSGYFPWRTTLYIYIIIH